MNTQEINILNDHLNDRAAVIKEPLGSGSGYWTGAPGVFFDEIDDAFYLTYRIRRPRGVEPDRGGETRIARSKDGREFEDIFSLKKSEIGSPSVERCALLRRPDGKWEYFVSFVDPADNRWRLSHAVSDRPDNFQASKIEPLLGPADVGMEAVKDPWITHWRGKWYLFLSVAVATSQTSRHSHATADIYNTGQCLTGTALAISEDLNTWNWRGLVLGAGGHGWDGYTRRITSAAPVEGGWIGFYDGIRSHEQNYEEQTGLAFSPDLVDWQVLTPAGPALTARHASGSLRYLDVVRARGRCFIYFEVAREDGSHELKVLEMDALPRLTEPRSAEQSLGRESSK